MTSVTIEGGVLIRAALDLGVVRAGDVLVVVGPDGQQVCVAVQRRSIMPGAPKAALDRPAKQAERDALILDGLRKHGPCSAEDLMNRMGLVVHDPMRARLQIHMRTSMIPRKLIRPVRADKGKRFPAYEIVEGNGG